MGVAHGASCPGEDLANSLADGRTPVRQHNRRFVPQVRKVLHHIRVKLGRLRRPHCQKGRVETSVDVGVADDLHRIREVVRLVRRVDLLVYT